jgi:hypothetical protein
MRQISSLTFPSIESHDFIPRMLVFRLSNAAASTTSLISERLIPMKAAALRISEKNRSFLNQKFAFV